MEFAVEVSEIVNRELGSKSIDLIQMMKDLDTPPIFLFGEDRERIVPIRRAAEEIIESWVAGNPDKSIVLHAQLPIYLQSENIAQDLLIAGISDRFFHISESSMVSPNAANRVFMCMPEILDHIDDDGLINIGDFDANPHGISYKNYSLYYHQFFRRNFTANTNIDLTTPLLTAANDSEIQVRVAVDEARVRYQHEHREMIERDYWHGPPLNDRLLDDPNEVGNTVYGEPEVSSIYPYIALSSRWKKEDKGRKSVEIEELVSVPHMNLLSQYAFARYVHAIRDTEQGCFIHFDAAVKAYEISAYPQKSEDFKNLESNFYRKVFRVDGTIATDLWVHIAVQWFRGNRLVLQYLSTLKST